MTISATGKMTNIGGIEFETKSVDFENTKVGPEIVTVTLKDGAVFTFSKTLQQAHIDKKMKQQEHCIPPRVFTSEATTKNGVSIPKYTTIFNCCFSSVKGAKEATTYELSNTKINTLDIKNGQEDTVEGGTIKSLICDDNDKTLYY
jgi:predicted aldo/keto reductase-like oxidoreductase